MPLIETSCDVRACFVVRMGNLVLLLKSFALPTSWKVELNLGACMAEEYSHVGLDDLA